MQALPLPPLVCDTSALLNELITNKLFVPSDLTDAGDETDKAL